MKYDLEPRILVEKPKNPKKLTTTLEKKLKVEQKNLKFQSARETLIELFEAYYWKEDLEKMLSTLCKIHFFNIHITIDLDGSTGITLGKMREYGMLPLSLSSKNKHFPSDLYNFCALMERLDIDANDVSHLYTDINKIYSNTGLFGGSAHSQASELEEVIEEYNSKRE